MIAVCQKGRKLSRCPATLLRAGVGCAMGLTSGNHGWREPGLVRQPPRTLLTTLPGGLWGIGRGLELWGLGCTWLIRRFRDPHAVIVLVPPAARALLDARDLWAKDGAPGDPAREIQP